MATATISPADLEVRRQLLREELAALEDQKLKSIGSMQVVDFHHPERSPGWPVYRHQAYPQMLYHSTEKDSRIEGIRLGVRRRNEANPTLAPMDVPISEAMTLKVFTAAEKVAAIDKGYVETPVLYSGPTVDGNSPLEMIGRGPSNPLIEQSEGKKGKR